MQTKKIDIDKVGEVAWWLLSGVILFFVFKYMILETPKVAQVSNNTNSNFAGVSKDTIFSKPHTKASDDSGFSMLYNLGQFDKTESQTIRNYEQFDILETRILDNKKYFRIFANEWISDKDLVIPQKYKITK